MVDYEFLTNKFLKKGDHIMSHEITANDKMYSVNEVPWHGLGTVISDYPTVTEAIEHSGLNWNVSLENMYVPMVIDDNDTSVNIEVPNQKAILRNDNHSVLGVVGSRYTLYQNSEMWSFIEKFQEKSGILLETAGSLKAGRTTWVLGKNIKERMEIVSNDPIEEYFLFKNSFDGSSPVSILFTNIRVVCNNTLTSALKGSKNTFNVRHTASMSGQIDQAEKALGLRYKYQESFKTAMDHLAKFKMGLTDMSNFISGVLFPMPTKFDQTVGQGDLVMSIDEIKGRAITVRNKRIEEMEEMIVAGAGADIPGVYGTGYGLYNAITEWADHSKQTRTTGENDPQETKFINSFYGTGATFKNDALNSLLKLAA